ETVIGRPDRVELAGVQPFGPQRVLLVRPGRAECLHVLARTALLRHEDGILVPWPGGRIGPAARPRYGGIDEDQAGEGTRIHPRGADGAARTHGMAEDDRG